MDRAGHGGVLAASRAGEGAGAAPDGATARRDGPCKVSNGLRRLHKAVVFRRRPHRRPIVIGLSRVTAVSFLQRMLQQTRESSTER